MPSVCALSTKDVLAKLRALPEVSKITFQFPIKHDPQDLPVELVKKLEDQDDLVVNVYPEVLMVVACLGCGGLTKRERPYLAKLLHGIRGEIKALDAIEISQNTDHATVRISEKHAKALEPAHYLFHKFIDVSRDPELIVSNPDTIPDERKKEIVGIIKQWSLYHQEGGAGRTHVIYHGKRRKVYGVKQDKYIKWNKTTVTLASIRGKYRYCV